MIAILLSWMLAAAAQETISVQPPLEVRIFDVTGLTRGFAEPPVPPVLGLGTHTNPGIVSREEMRVVLTGEELRDVIRDIDRDSWDNDGATIDFNNGLLIVRHQRALLDKIPGVLTWLHKTFFRRVAIEGYLVSVDPAAYLRIRGDGGAALTAEQARQLLTIAREGKEGELLESMKVSAPNGSRTVLWNGVSHTYVGEYNVQLAIGSILADPVPSRVRTGSQLTVRPILGPLDQSIVLEVIAQDATLISMEDRMLESTVRIGNGDKDAPSSPPETALRSKVQLPRVSLNSFATNVTVGNGETIVIGSTLQGNRLRLLMMSAVAVRTHEPPPGGYPLDGGKRQLRILDPRIVVARTQFFPGPDLALREGRDDGATFSIDEPMEAKLSQEQVIELLKMKAPEGSWDNDNLIELTPAGVLRIRQSPEVIALLDAELRALATRSSRMITVEGIAVGIRKEARATWEKDLGVSIGGFVETAAVEKLAAEALKGGGSYRLMGRSQIATRPESRVHAARVRQDAFVADHEPQVTTSASGYDPTIETLETGFVLDVQPIEIEGSDVIAVILDAKHVEAETLELKGVNTGMAGIDVPRTTEFRWSGDIECRAGMYTMVAASTSKAVAGGEDVLFFIRARASATK